MPLPDNQTLVSFWLAAALEGNILLLMHLIGSMLLGMLVGYERSYHGRAAGMRTFSLVCMASTALIAVFGYPELWFGGQPINFRMTDGPARVIQGIVTGLGFLGAGVIVREGRSVTGLSTAASIWVAAAIGILVGLGLYVAAIALALLCAFSMSIVVQIEGWLPKQKRFYFELSFEDRSAPSNDTLAALTARFGFYLRLDTVSISLSKTHQHCSFTAATAPRNHTDMNGLASALENLPGLEKYAIMPARN